MAVSNKNSQEISFYDLYELLMRERRPHWGSKYKIWMEMMDCLRQRSAL